MVLKSTGLPVNQFVECTRCLEASHDDSSVQEWAELHAKEQQGHTLFRTVSTASWFLVPRRNTQDSADQADTPD
ncbi:DUF7848 domain-containing protein [Streptomyces chartreusis]